MPLQATSGAASYDAFGGGVPVVPQYIEDVFSTYLYTNNGGAINIDNGIDLSGKGGLLWEKQRNGTGVNQLVDSARGSSKYLVSNNTDSEQNGSGVTFTSTGFSYTAGWNGSMASWTFRKQPKFFDVVTYTGTSSAQNIAHNLGSTPACIIVKKLNDASIWPVYHASLGGADKYLTLNTTDASDSAPSLWNNTAPTSTQFTVGTSGSTNGSGNTFVAYIFAHDAGGFGLTGTDNVISCGTFTGSSFNVNLGYEPQWIMFKRSDADGQWFMLDTMRGDSLTAQSYVKANASDAESTNPAAPGYPAPTATGFYGSIGPSGAEYIYIAIRRGPMKVPTVGTSVYQANTYTGNATANTTVAGNFGFPVDLLSLSNRSADATNWSTYGHYMIDRLRGSEKTSGTANANTESGGWSTYNAFDVQNSIGWGLYGASSDTGYMNNSGGLFVARGFRRAPSFFDEVCYTGDGSLSRSITTALDINPNGESLVIIKSRSNAIRWSTTSPLGNKLVLNTNGSNNSYGGWPSGAYNRQFDLYGYSYQNGVDDVNASGQTYVAYIFSTCAGVSKTGSYSGTGGLQTIDCGFTSGARFVMIKRADSTGDWYVWDSARGIVSGNDPYLLLNSTAAEVTNTDYIDPYSAGFEISSTAPAAINASGGTFLFLAIA